MFTLFITLYTVHFDIPAPRHLTLGISSPSESCTLSVIPRWQLPWVPLQLVNNYKQGEAYQYFIYVLLKPNT